MSLEFTVTHLKHLQGVVLFQGDVFLDQVEEGVKGLRVFSGTTHNKLLADNLG